MRLVFANHESKADDIHIDDVPVLASRSAAAASTLELASSLASSSISSAPFPSSLVSSIPTILLSYSFSFFSPLTTPASTSTSSSSSSSFLSAPYTAISQPQRKSPVSKSNCNLFSLYCKHGIIHSFSLI